MSDMTEDEMDAMAEWVAIPAPPGLLAQFFDDTNSHGHRTIREERVVAFDRGGEALVIEETYLVRACIVDGFHRLTWDPRVRP